MDPLTKEYPWNSTYTFAENDVIRCIDLDGLEKWEVTFHPLLMSKPKLQEGIKQSNVARNEWLNTIHHIADDLVLKLNEKMIQIKNQNDYNTVFETVKKNVQTTVKLDPNENMRGDLDYTVSDLDIEYNGKSLNEFKRDKNKETAIDVAKIANWLRPKVTGIIKKKGPSLFQKIVGPIGYLFKFQETGKSSITDQEASEKEMLEKETLNALENYLINSEKKSDTKPTNAIENKTKTD